MHDELARRRAASRYRQVRFTATLEARGSLTYSVYAKPLNKAWDEHQCILRGSIEGVPPLMSPDDVFLALIDVLREQTLPGI